MSAEISGNPSENAQSTFFTDKTGWTEDISQRSLYTSTMKKGDGHVMIETCLRPIHYLVDGKWERIHSEIIPVNNHWEALQQPFPVSIDADGKMHMASGLDEECVFARNVVFNGQQTQVVHQQKTDRSLIAENIVPDVNLELNVSENAVKYQYVVHTGQSIIGNFLEIMETLSLPKDAVIKADTKHGKLEGDSWSGNLLFVLQNKVIGSIGGAFCYDQQHHTMLGAYSWKALDDSGTWELKTSIPKSWLNAAETIYPVVIDPLITGPLSDWGLEPMPSCLIPAYNVDSILVTVPGEITVTGLFVTASFYADVFADAIMDDGAMYFSTACGQTGLFESQPPDNALPGTAYLLSFDMRNPLMCCYEPTCSETSFYLRMHLGRNTPEGDCNFTYVYYNPTTPWPFTAFIEGHTVEKHNEGWSIPSAPICSNDCEVTAKARMRYGVPPYVVTHPWMIGSLVLEQPEPCDLSGKLQNCPLIIPDCPVYCPDFNTLDVPPCVITDACLNVAPDIPFALINIKPAPDISIDPVIICSNQPNNLPFVSCSASSVFSWAGNNTSGDGSTPIQVTNNSMGILEVDCFATAEINGCFSEEIEFTVNVLPSPIADFEVDPNPAVLGTATSYFDQSINPVGDVVYWQWSFDGIPGGSDQNVTYSSGTLGLHEVCLQIKTEEGCPATVCKFIEVTVTNIVAPNIFTPNGDAFNDFLEFENLRLFPDNLLQVWNRWGNKVYSKSGYANNWNGDGFEDGTYYYILNVKNIGDYSGYFQIVR